MKVIGYAVSAFCFRVARVKKRQLYFVREEEGHKDPKAQRNICWRLLKLRNVKFVLLYLTPLQFVSVNISEGSVNGLGAVLNVQLFIYFMNMLPNRGDGNGQLICYFFVEQSPGQLLQYFRFPRA